LALLASSISLTPWRHGLIHNTGVKIGNYLVQYFNRLNYQS